MVEEKVRKACGIIEKTDNEIVEELLNSDWEIDEMEVEIRPVAIYDQAAGQR